MSLMFTDVCRTFVETLPSQYAMCVHSGPQLTNLSKPEALQHIWWEFALTDVAAIQRIAYTSKLWKSIRRSWFWRMCVDRHKP